MAAPITDPELADAAARLDAAGVPPGPGEAGAEPQDGSEQPKRKRDKAPRSRSKRSRASSSTGASGQLRGAPLKAQSKRLEEKLGELLVFPSVPAAMFAPDIQTQAYMVEHFTRSGPRTAAVLVEASESNPQLRALLERAVAGGGMFTVAIALATYVAPPVLWIIGMRAQAAMMTQATTMTPEDAQRMMDAANAAAAAQAQAAEPPPQPEQPGAEGAAWAPTAVADPLEHQPGA